MCSIPGGGTKLLPAVPQKTRGEVLCQGQGQKVEGEKAIHLVVFGLKKHPFVLLYMSE